ncbi:SusC/RagA family TonB-linked outer membrane protein [Chitinophaga sp. MM2321]|uniref:SusC/RagA family TonB-linked outer membrane protein n=1 Tax=Chitinophaga sp. MM2321 TaxID=3137178 RepID=UPI0032D5B0CF
MRLSAVLLLFSALHISATGLSQKITLSSHNMPLEKVFREIKRQAGMSFLLDQQLLKHAHPVSMEIKNATIREALDLCLKDQPLTYEILKDLVVIKKRTTAPVNVVITADISKKITVRGTVRNPKGEVLPGVVVTIKNSSTGTVTKEDGTYSIVADEQDVLVFGLLGFEKTEIVVDGKATIDVVLQDNRKDLGEVVVTALGIKKEVKSLGYSVQEVKAADAFEKVKEPNVLSSLSGRVAGLVISNKTGLYETPDFLLRGATPLVVVDGVPVNSDFWDVNANDIENINVIKGATGSALYGSRGKNGVVMITTKRGTKDKRGVSVNFNSSGTFQNSFIVFPEVQHRYGSGFGGQYAFVDGKGGGVQDGAGYVWGPELDQADPSSSSGYWETTQFNSQKDPQTGQLIPMPWISRGKNNLKNFLETGYILNNNISIAGQNKDGNYRVSLTQFNQKGMAPNTKLKGNTVAFNGGYKFSKRLTVDASVNYNKQYSDNYEQQGYGSQNFLYNMLIFMGADVDIRDMKNYWKAGQEGYVQNSFNNLYYNNPYWLLNEVTREYDKNVINGYVKADYTFNEHLKLMARTGTNWFSTYSTYNENLGWIDWGKLPDGEYRVNNDYYFDINSDVLLSYDKKLSDKWGLSAAAGANSRSTTIRNQYASTDAIVVPGLYNLANKATQVEASNSKSEKRVNSLYGMATIDYKNALFLTLTGRKDWSSSLPPKNNSYFYPSVSLSGVLSEFIKMPAFVTFAKLRGSWAKVGGDLDPYGYIPTYSYATTWGTTPSVTVGNGIYNSNIRPQFSSTYEVGTDLRFLNNRLGIDVAYYKILDIDQIIWQSVALSSGYASRQINAMEFYKKGVEITLNATPVKLSNSLQWNVQVNWSRMRSYLGELAPGEEKYQGIYASGDQLGLARGTGWEKSPDGQIIYNNGRPVMSNYPQDFGYYDAKWTGGIVNNFKYRNFSLGFVFDGRYGGKIYSVMSQQMMVGGVAKETAVGDIRTKPYVGAGVVVTGGDVTRDEAGKIISDTRTFAPNTTGINYFDWVNAYYNRMFETNIFDATFLKLREVTFTYSLPKHVLGRTFIKDASVSLVGRNMAIFFTELPFLDPDSFKGDNQNPSPRSMGFNLNVTF